MKNLEAVAPATGDYEVDRQRHVEAFVDGLAEEIALVSAPRAELHALRDRRLTDLLRHAREHSPWHAERLRSIDPDAVSGDDLSALPTMTKSDLMDHWDEIVCDTRLDLAMVNEHIDRTAENGLDYLLDEYHAVATGGTTGVRGVMVWDFEGFRLTSSRALAWGIATAGHLGVESPLPMRVANVGSVGATHLGGAITRCFSNPALRETIAVAASRPIDEIVDELEAIQPHILGGYASVLHALADRKQRGELTISPIGLTQAGEPFLPEAQAAVVEAFGVPARDMWGTTEVGMAAASFPGFEGLFISEDLVIVEPVAADGRPTPLGERSSKVLVTNLANRVLPIIRYEISDEVTLAAADPGSPWKGQRLVAIHGRQDDAFHYGSLRVHPHAFRSVLTRYAGVTEYQVRQTADGADVSVVAHSHIDLGRLQDDLTAALSEAGLRDPHVRLETTMTIDRHPQSQKLKRFVPM
jgi:phenylacetate-coenzyme A ligase PaaK-like adenylate-forming protein